MRKTYIFMLLLIISSGFSLTTDFLNPIEFGDTSGTDTGCQFYYIKENYFIGGTASGLSVYHSEEDGCITLIDTLHTDYFGSFVFNDSFLAISSAFGPNIDVYNIEDMNNVYYSHTILTNYNIGNMFLISNNRLIISRFNDTSLVIDIAYGDEITIFQNLFFITDSCIDEENLLVYDYTINTNKWISLDSENHISEIRLEDRQIDFASSDDDHIFLVYDNYVKMYDSLSSITALDSIFVNYYDLTIRHRGIEINDSKLFFVDTDYSISSQMEEPVLRIYNIDNNGFEYFAREFFLENWDNRDYYLLHKVILCNGYIYINAEEEGIKGYQLYDNQLEQISQYGEIAYWENSFLNRDGKIFLNARKKDRECVIYDFSNGVYPTLVENDYAYGQYSSFPFQSEYIYKKSYLDNEVEFYHVNNNNTLSLIGSINEIYYYLYENFIPLMLDDNFLVYQFINNIYVGVLENGVFVESYNFNLGAFAEHKTYATFMKNGHLYSIDTSSNVIDIYSINNSNYSFLASDSSHDFTIHPGNAFISYTNDFVCFRGDNLTNYLLSINPDTFLINSVYNMNQEERMLNNIENYLFVRINGLIANGRNLEIIEFNPESDVQYNTIDTIRFPSCVLSVDFINENDNISDMIVTTMGSIFYFQCAITPNGNLDITPVILNSSNYPNPFNPETTISYHIPKKGNVTVDIYNIKGQKVRSLLKEEQEVGQHSIIWKGHNDQGQKVSSGTYLYRVKSGDEEIVNKMMLVK